MYDLSKDRILIVDDEPDNLEVLKATLELLYGASVKTVLGGEEALASLSTFRPTVIVTDLSMPKVDGYTLLYRIRREVATAGLPVIVLSAHAMNGDRERVLAAGFDGYISKPFDVVSLGDNIIASLEQFYARRNAPATQVGVGTTSNNSNTLQNKPNERTDGIK
ncbi:MAG TPA: response regulator [Aggregatilineales bacterium]|nr:response regulator [Aggregatilineales bacterium]